MIAACPKCGARYRIERERLQAGSVRLRCARCEAVFRVRTPEAVKLEPAAVQTRAPAAAAEPERAPPPPAVTRAPTTAAAPPPSAASPKRDAERVLVAMPDGELAKRTAEALAQRGLAVLRASDGVEAMLEIQRKLPRAVVLAADLPKMFGFQICEVVKRNESLRGIWVVLVGAIHHSERYRRAPGELYGADAYVDGPELPEGLLPLLARGGLQLATVSTTPLAEPRDSARAAPSLRAPLAGAEAVRPAVALDARRAALAEPPRPVREAPAPAAAPVAKPRPAPPPPGRSVATPLASGSPRAPLADGLEDERAKAERLARIVISDIVLYNDERFAAAVRAGNVVEAMAGDLAEGRQLFEERIDPRVRSERDHLKDELLLRAKARGTR